MNVNTFITLGFAPLPYLVAPGYPTTSGTQLPNPPPTQGSAQQQVAPAPPVVYASQV